MIGTEPVTGAPPTECFRAAASALPAKIRPDHHDRLAVVYVRQSDPQQVLKHRESTDLQYKLQRRAIEWGWSSERVLVIDEDQGHTATTAEGRSGYQQLLAEIALDHVGLILGIQMSRLARSNKDWHQLLEVCAIFGTVLADEDGIYDPRDYNDRLLLGLKGTLSEAELHMLCQRMHLAQLNKARRGELFNHAPIGYVRLATGELALDPDEQVQTVVHLIFDKFDEFGTVGAVLRYLSAHNLQLPVRPHSGSNRGNLEWRRPIRNTLGSLLHHPIYAGAYTWGRHRLDPRRKIPGRPNSGKVLTAPEECAAFLKDHCPAYITWERYEANQRQITENQARTERRGAVREGCALLGGLLVCGRCGCRMIVHYQRSSQMAYVCKRRALEYGEPLCQGLSGGVLDALITQQVFKVLEPAALELSLSATEQIERERNATARHWKQRLERTRYETDRARRQYDVVEPENRLVARELERRWEQTLLQHRTLEDEYDRFQRSQAVALTDAERDLIRSLTNDVPELWHSPKTSWADRQMVVRLLIHRVVVTAPPNSQHVDVSIQWAGDYSSQHTLVRPVGRYERVDNLEQIMTRIFELRKEKRTSTEIAEHLNREGFRSARRRTFTREGVRKLLSRHRRCGKGHNAAESGALAPHEWQCVDLARHLDIPEGTLYGWVRRGWVHARQLPGAGGKWILWVDDEETDRLRKLHGCPQNWHRTRHSIDLTQPKVRSAS